MKNQRFTFWAMVLVLLVSGSASPVLAHKVYLFAWAENGVVYTESSFGDKKVIQGKIQVKDERGAPVTSGTTDDQGNFSFKIPENPVSDLVVTLDASMGHQAVWTVSLKEMQAAMDKATAKEIHGAAMAKKAELEKGPSLARIIAGIGIIFALSLLGAWVHGRVNRRQIKRSGDD